MSGPVSTSDAPTDGAGASPEGSCVEVTPSRETEVGGVRVRRALPQRARRTVGAWCFVDHLGPVTSAGIEIGPHPHIGLQTVTWLLAGNLLHRDSLGSEQPIRPGQLNLMTAGHGVSHAEEAIRSRGAASGEGSHGVQLWVAQPERTRHDPPAFEHHAELPVVELPNATATVLVGSFAGARSPARCDTDHIGADLAVRGHTTVPLDPAHEHAVVALDGVVTIDGQEVVPGHLAYLGMGRDAIDLDAIEHVRVLLLGGVPFESAVLMWWNFVARTHDEIDAARADWQGDSDRFGDPGSPLERIDAPVPPWTRST